MAWFGDILCPVRHPTGDQASDTGRRHSHPTEAWIEQAGRNLTDVECGALRGQRYVLHDRDTKSCSGFRSILRDGGVEPSRLPARSPDLKALNSYCTS
jgi:hypothetical protein